ncbi:MAG: histidinol dehydrogenase [Spirochaetaceae bacterium]|nr:histidinol dehydrogenase [Spirochaetaceae bacterium]
MSKTEGIAIISSQDIPASFYGSGRLSSKELSDTVRSVLTEVKEKGDTALHQYAQKFDKADPTTFEISQEAMKMAAEKMQQEKPDLYEALCYSRDMALQFAKKQRECFMDFETELAEGVFTGQKNIPVEKAGVYVPGGLFPLLSSVIMGTMPAKAANVQEIILCSPPKLHPTDPYLPWVDEGIMAAAFICGVDHLYACGGSQAIAAMAFGTESIPKVDVIVGPGNRFVSEAKKLVYGEVGIDMLAGPTEVFIIADDSANPEWVAADLLAQAEHAFDSQAILATDSIDLAQKVQAAVKEQLSTLPTQETAQSSIEKYSCIIVCKNLTEAAEIANKKMPEHLELAMDKGVHRDTIEQLVHNYGSLFIGHESAEVFGDYAAGLNHTLPTAGSARFTGGLSVRHFIKTVTTLRVEDNSLGMQKIAKSANELGLKEGLEAHAAAARFRFK